MFSSVCDASNTEPPTPATWVNAEHATPIDRYYGFDHTSDEFAEKIKVTLPALGLDKLGPRTSAHLGHRRQGDAEGRRCPAQPRGLALHAHALNTSNTISEPRP
jgi:hypothetical protein